MKHTDGSPLPHPAAVSSWYRKTLRTDAGTLVYEERLWVDDEESWYEYRRARVGDRIVHVDELRRILDAARKLSA